MIVSKTPEKVMRDIQDTFLVKAIGPPDYYLGKDYKQDGKGRLCYGCQKYIKEAI